MTPFTDPLDEQIIYSCYNTVAIGIQHEGARSIGVRGLSKHNLVFDALREPETMLPILLNIPCFIRILDEPIFNLLESQIILQYRDPADTSLPPLIVIGGGKLHEHPLIFKSTKETASDCWNIYKKYRRRARRLARKDTQ